MAYNHSDSYVNEVLALARAYASGIPVADIPLVGNTTGPIPAPGAFASSGGGARYYGGPAAPGPPIGASDTTPASGPTTGASPTGGSPRRRPRRPGRRGAGGGAAALPATPVAVAAAAAGPSRRRPAARAAALRARNPAVGSGTGTRQSRWLRSLPRRSCRRRLRAGSRTRSPLPPPPPPPPAEELVPGVTCTLLDPLGQKLMPGLPVCP